MLPSNGGTIWSRPSIVNEAIAAFLRAETYSAKCRWKRHHIINEMLQGRQEILNNPNLTDGKENSIRYRALLSIRRDIIWNLPPDTVWSKSIDSEWMAPNRPHCLSPKTARDLEPYKNEKLDLTGIWLWWDMDTKTHYVIEGNYRVSQWIHNGAPQIRIPEIFILYSASNMPYSWVCNYRERLGTKSHNHRRARETIMKPFIDHGIINHWSVLYDGHQNHDISLSKAMSMIKVTCQQSFLPWLPLCRPVLEKLATLLFFLFLILSIIRIESQ
jgi:hypothetical protein